MGLPLSIPGSTPPLFVIWCGVFESQNLPLPPRIYPSFSTNVCVRPYNNLPLPPRIPPFSTTICDPPIIYPSLPEYTPFSKKLYVQPSQNLPLPSRIYPPFQPFYMCDPPRIYPSLPESIPLFNQFICATLP